MRLSLVLQAIDRVSGPARQAQSGVVKLTGSMRDAARAASPAAAAVDRMRATTGRLPAILDHATAASRRFRTNGLVAMERAAERTGFAIGSLVRKAGKIALTGAGALAVGGVAAGAALGRGVITNAAKFEQYQASLEGIMGSASKAKEAMAWVADFAAKTPYEIDEITAAFTAAKNAGIDPMTGAFQSLGDTAGAVGKTFIDAIDMMADAQTFQFERLREFGITASSSGKNVSFSYIDKAGKKASKSVIKDAIAIREALLSILSGKYGGGMERQSRTLLGIWSNLKDSVTRFQLAVASKGFYDVVKKDLAAVLEWTNRITADGRMDRWAQRPSDVLTVLWNKAKGFIETTDWKAVAVGIGSIASALIDVIGWIAKAASAWGNWQMDVERRRLQRTIDSPTVWEYLFTDRNATVAKAKGDLKNLDRLQYGSEQARQEGNRVVWPEGAFSKRRTTRPTLSGNAPAPSPAKPQKISLEIYLKGPGAPQASVRRMSASSDTTFSVSRGRAMQGPA